MLTEEEINALVDGSLGRALKGLSGLISPDAFQPCQLDSGEYGAIYSGTSQEGYGSYSCRYMPREAVRRIVVYCDRQFEDFLTTTDGVAREIVEANRDISIKSMVDVAVLHLVSSFGSRLQEVMEEIVDESHLISGGLVAASVSRYLGQITKREYMADGRAQIEQAVKRVAKRRRTLLRTYLKALPNVMVEKRRGAKPKSESERSAASVKYASQVERAYRRVREKQGRRPKKKEIAIELREGGINPKTFGDSRLNAFNLKLKRLNVDYSAIAKRVEDESTQ